MNGFLAAIPWLVPGWLEGERLTPFREALAREGHLRDVTVDGRTYALVDRGKGPALVLLHGLGGSIYDWRHLLEPLSRDRRVVAIDFLGAGESDKPEAEDYSIAAQARRLRGILDALRINRAVLMGNSYGGGVALRFAQDWPDRVDRLVLLNSVCYAEDMPCYVYAARIPWAECMAGLIPLGKVTRRVLRGTYRTVEKLKDEELDTYIAELRAPGRREAVVRTVRDLVPPDTSEFESRLRTVKAPALLLWGTSDGTVPVALGRRLAKDLPDARLVELDAGHVPNQECPDEVLRHVRDFLR
jgi:pimeloyl-ACP methyl ester carboxylesterase